MWISIASVLRDVLALFKAEGSPEYNMMVTAIKDLTFKPVSAIERLITARGAIASKGQKAGENYFKRFIKSLEKLNPINRNQMKSALEEALEAIPQGTEWRSPFNKALVALQYNKFDVEGTMPDLYEGTTTHISEALKALGYVEEMNQARMRNLAPTSTALDNAKTHIQFAMNLYKASTPLIIRQQFTPLPC